MTALLDFTLLFHSLHVTALRRYKVLGNKGGYAEKVWKEWCYGRTETLEDAEEVVQWWG